MEVPKSPSVYTRSTVRHSCICHHAAKLEEEEEEEEEEILFCITHKYKKHSQ